jgi:hypothetical protein
MAYYNVTHRSLLLLKPISSKLGSLGLTTTRVGRFEITEDCEGHSRRMLVVESVLREQRLPLQCHWRKRQKRSCRAYNSEFTLACTWRGALYTVFFSTDDNNIQAAPLHIATIEFPYSHSHKSTE